MTLNQVVHQFEALLRGVSPERRLLVIDFVRSGYDGDGDAIEHERWQEDVLTCIDCQKQRSDCAACREISR